MKKILFTTDFSANANKAFNFALNLAEKHKAELIMAYIFDVPNVFNYPVEYNPSEMKPETIKRWQRELKEFFDHYKTTVKATFVSDEHPSVTKGILSIIESHKPDVIVLGTRGKSRLKEVFLGSTTKSLVKRSPIPVIAIPEYADLQNYDKILYASDFQEVDLYALKKLVELIQPYKSEITILHISTESEYQGNEKMDWFKALVKKNIDYKKFSYQVIFSDSIFNALYKHLSENDYGMLVMLEKERSGIFDSLFHEDLVKKMEFRTWVPLLSFNESNLEVPNDSSLEKSNNVDH